ncbi:hypothetical protein CEXT_657181 [Caerostris extrusa]|uniref:LAGLIDADG homing endonuclease n=1 Tax=Caerostris extrusa TaxID=172846 RepID=A0AAV4WS40_CAEEX|nr:hypothetical protein CEXT_657181 [Caerostris extrusa]
MRKHSRLGSSLEKFNRELLEVIYFAVGLKTKEEQGKGKVKTENWSYGIDLKGKVWKIINGAKKKAFTPVSYKGTRKWIKRLCGRDV